MGRFKSIAIGHRVVQAGKLRRCSHDRTHTIAKGEPCLEVREGLGWKGYCVACGIAMVAVGEADLRDLRGALGTSDPAAPRGSGR